MTNYWNYLFNWIRPGSEHDLTELGGRGRIHKIRSQLYPEKHTKSCQGGCSFTAFRANALVSDDMKEGPTLSSMGEIETIYAGGWYHDVHRIRSSQKWTQIAAIDDQGKIIERVLNDSNFLKGFLKGTAGTVEWSGRSWTDVGLDIRHSD